jgi:predicted MFS family arabinose efflux permease
VAGLTITDGLRGYRDLLAQPGAAPMVLWGLLARAPVGMVALALVLLLRGEGRSYADAGIVTGAEALAFSLGSPVAGRLIDRRRPALVLLGYGLAFPSALLVLTALALAGGGLWLLIAASAVAGLVFPPISSTVRMLWPSLVSSQLQTTAFALEATVQELLFVTGPLVVGALAALIAPSAGIVAAAAISLVGVLGFAASGPVRGHRHRPSHEQAHRHLLSALSPPLVRRIVAISAGYGLAFGAVEVAMPAFAEGHGGRALGSICLAAWSGGSLIGGLLAAGHRPADPQRRLRLISALFAAALVLPLLAGSLPAMAAIMLLVGLPIAPSFALTYGMVQAAALPGTQAEVFGWLSTAVVVGVAVGASLGGSLITHSGTEASLLLGIAGAAVAAAVCALPPARSATA